MENPTTIDMDTFDHFTSCFHQAIDCLKRVNLKDPGDEPRRAALETLAQAIWTLFESIESNETVARYLDLARTVDALADQVWAFAHDALEIEEMSFAAVNLMRLSEVGLRRRAVELSMDAHHDTAALQQGAQGLIDLLDTIHDIGNATCNRLGDRSGEDQDQDTRDYPTMASTIAETFAHYLGQPADSPVYQGFLRALTDLIAITADGCGIPRQGWDPIENTEFAFSGQLGHALMSRRTEPRNLIAEPAPEPCAPIVDQPAAQAA